MIRWHLSLTTLTLRNPFGCLESSFWNAPFYLSRTCSQRWFYVIKMYASLRTLAVLRPKLTQAPTYLVAVINLPLWCLILVLRMI